MSINGARSGVIAGYGKIEISVVAVEQPAQVAGSAEDVLPGIERVQNTQLFCDCWHELHEPLRTGARHRQGVERRLRTDNGSNQIRIEAIEIGGLGMVSSYARDAGRGRKPPK